MSDTKDALPIHALESFHKLTPSVQALLTEYVRQGMRNLAGCYEIAISDKSNYPAQNAWKLINKEDAQAVLKEYKNTLAKQDIAEASEIAARLSKIALGRVKDATPADQIKACTSLARMLGYDEGKLADNQNNVIQIQMNIADFGAGKLDVQEINEIHKLGESE